MAQNIVNAPGLDPNELYDESVIKHKLKKNNKFLMKKELSN